MAELELLDITHNNMVARWKAAQGASGYMILYAPLTEGDPADEKEVCVCVNRCSTGTCSFCVCTSSSDSDPCSLLTTFTHKHASNMQLCRNLNAAAEEETDRR